MISAIEAVMYGHFIKYDSLERMTKEAFSHSNSNNLNVFVDMSSMLKPVYRLTEQLRMENPTTITSSIINLCAHIRAYYRTRHNVETTIYIVDSDNCPISAMQFYSDYNYATKLSLESGKRVLGMINNNREILSILCPYIPNVYYIQDTYETSVVIKNLIDTIAPKNPNIIISKDIFTYQLPAVSNMDTVIFRPFKDGVNDRSWVVNNTNVLSRYILDSRNSHYETNDINPALLSLIMAMSNLPCRNIHSIYNINSSLKTIRKLIEDRQILNGYNSIINLSQVYWIKEGFTIDQRFKCIDILNQYAIYLNSPRAGLHASSIVDLYDPQAIQEINNKYFMSNPLDLNRL